MTKQCKAEGKERRVAVQSPVPPVPQLEVEGGGDAVAQLLPQLTHPAAEEDHRQAQGEQLPRI